MEKNIDKHVDETLEKCILASPRKSFFLFAGAGSGKTYSLVLLLKKIRDSIGQELLLQGKQVAVITFTNAATDEIVNRLDYSPVFHISTIHSFVWDVIKFYQADIKKLYCEYIEEDIQEVQEKLDSAKNKTTKTYFSNVEKSEKLTLDQQATQYIMLGLRLARGVEAKEYKLRFGRDLEEDYGEKIQKYIDLKYAKRTDKGFRLTRAGLLVSNTILSDILDFS